MCGHCCRNCEMWYPVLNQHFCYVFGGYTRDGYFFRSSRGTIDHCNEVLGTGSKLRRMVPSWNYKFRGFLLRLFWWCHWSIEISLRLFLFHAWFEQYLSDNNYHLVDVLNTNQQRDILQTLHSMCKSVQKNINAYSRTLCHYSVTISIGIKCSFKRTIYLANNWQSTITWNDVWKKQKKKINITNLIIKGSSSSGKITRDKLRLFLS